MEYTNSQIPGQEPKILIAPIKPRKSTIKIIFGIVALAILVFAISLYTRAFDPLWNPFRPKPDKVIEEMTTKIGGLKTVHSKTKIDIGSKEDTKEVSLSIESNSDSDTTDSQNPKSAGDFSISISFEGMQFSLTGESKTIGKDSYLKLKTFPASPFIAPFLSQIGIDISELENQWIKVDQESMNNLLKSLGAPLTPELEQETKKSEEKQKEMVQKLQALLKNKKLYVVKKEFPDEKIKNTKTYHYLVALNKEEIKKLIPELLKEVIGMGVFPKPPTEAEWQKFEKEFPAKFDEFFRKIGDIEGQIWIGKKDLYLYKIEGEKEIDLAKIDPATAGKITVNFDMDFSNFNQPVKIEAPTNFKTLEEIIAAIIDERIKDDISKIALRAEMIYHDNSSYEKLCAEPPLSTLNKDPTSYDGYVLSTLESDIRDLQGGNLDLICLDSITSYCIQAKLRVTNQRYCVDFKRIKKTIDENQTCLGTGTSKNPYRCP